MQSHNQLLIILPYINAHCSVSTNCRYHEFLGTFFFDHLWMMRLVQEIIKLHVKSVVKDKVLLDKVIPKYLMGCKR